MNEAASAGPRLRGAFLARGLFAATRERAAQLRLRYRASRRGLHLFYNIFSTRDKAEAQHREQLGTLRNSGLLVCADGLHFDHRRGSSIRGDVERHCRDMGIRRCVTSDTSTAAWRRRRCSPYTFCRQNKAAVAYIHDKGSFHDHPKQAPLKSSSSVAWRLPPACER